MDKENSFSSNTTVDERSGHSEAADSIHVGRSTVNLHEVPTTSEQVNIETRAESSAPITQEPPMDGKYWPVSRVPAHVREVENGAYTPKIVSIGPFHYKESSPTAFKDQKTRFLSRLEKQFSVEVLENAMREMEGNTRKCYSERLEINSDDFVRMMLLDGCFIVELLRLYDMRTNKGYDDVEEPILETRWMVPNIGRDLLMLENQLPMFVLQKIYAITTPASSEETDPLNKLALRFFEPLRPGKEKLSDDILNTNQEHPHLLALFQSTFMNQSSLLPNRGNQSEYDEIPGKGWVHNATTLRYAGVRFKTKSGNILDIEYKNTVLTIPTLYIDDGTSTLLRNLIAYEQSNRSANPYFSCLAVFLDSLVDTVDDINILRDAGIINQPKVVNLFNCLTKGVEIDMNDCYIIEPIQDINRRCRSQQASIHVGRSTVNLHEVPTTSEQVNIEITPSELSASIIRIATQEPPMDGKYWPVSRVPAHVREVEKGAYTPKIVSIGPFHHNEPSVRAFEDQKIRFLSRLHNQISVEVLGNAMREMEGNTRKCYSENFEGINSDDFVRMMLLDGCFIVELLRLYDMRTNKGNDGVEEPILETRWMVPNIGRDLLMLENQLPMSVLHKIFDITTPIESEATDPLNKLALRFFEPLRPGKDKLSDNILNMYTKQEHPHLLALFQSTFMNPNSLLPEGDNQSEYEKIPGKGWVHNATTLRFAGVRFKTKSGNFHDLEYKNTVLTIPTLYIDDGSSTLLRNLIAYEQSNRSANPYFSCLAVFMDSIVDTVNDINILLDAGIIKQPKGGDQEVVNLFNCLTKGVEVEMDDCYIIKQIQGINRRCRSMQAVVRLRRFLSASNYKSIFILTSIFTAVAIFLVLLNSI